MELIRAEHGTPEWHELRASGIGGSDAAAVMGLSKWKTPYQLWEEKTSEIRLSNDNEAMLWGRTLEPVIRQQYAERTYREVRTFDGTFRSKEYPFMLANLDGLTEDNRILEVKTSRYDYGWGMNGSNEVPQEYYLQVQHYMAVTNTDFADIAVLIGGCDFRIYEIEADKELHRLMIEAERSFWDFVVNKTPPDVSTLEDVARLYKESRAGQVYASNEALQKIAELQNLKAQSTLLEQQEKDLKLAIQMEIGDNDTLVDMNGRVVATWKSAKSTERFDTKTFKETYPDLYGKFTTIGESSRRFLIK